MTARNAPTAERSAASRAVFASALAWTALSVAAWAAVFFLASTAPGCRHPIDTQAVAATAVAATGNALIPALFDEGGAADIDLTRALESRCPLRNCTAEQANDVRASWERRWSAVVAAHEAARLAVNGWQDVIRSCHQRGDVDCAPALAEAVRIIPAVGQWRCALRAIGRDDLDRLPLPAPTCPTIDGGVR